MIPETIELAANHHTLILMDKDNLAGMTDQQFNQLIETIRLNESLERLSFLSFQISNLSNERLSQLSNVISQHSSITRLYFSGSSIDKFKPKQLQIFTELFLNLKNIKAIMFFSSGLNNLQDDLFRQLMANIFMVYYRQEIFINGEDLSFKKQRLVLEHVFKSPYITEFECDSLKPLNKALIVKHTNANKITSYFKPATEYQSALLHLLGNKFANKYLPKSLKLRPEFLMELGIIIIKLMHREQVSLSDNLKKAFSAHELLEYMSKVKHCGNQITNQTFTQTRENQLLKGVNETLQQENYNLLLGLIDELTNSLLPSSNETLESDRPSVGSYLNSVVSNFNICNEKVAALQQSFQLRR